jgi:hypothetical protein
MTWKKIVEHQDGKCHYYAYVGEGLKTDGRTDSRLGLSFRMGQNVKIRWPDGSITEDLNITVGTDNPDKVGIITIYRGKNVFISLDGLEIFDSSDEGEWSLL